jgi:hypothetical protein
MKKQLMILAVVLLSIAIVAPAFAAVEFKYGGQFRWRFESENNVNDGIDGKDAFAAGYNTAGVLTPGSYRGDDNRTFIDQRLRLYFSFIASKNLKVVAKFDMGDTVWGNPRTSGSSGIGNTSSGGGGNVGADGVAIEVKNAYVEFNIPNTPTTAIIGIQSAVLLDSWIIDDDFAAAVFVTKLDPFTVALGYVGGQTGWERKFAGATVDNTSQLPFTNQQFNVDDFFVAIDYKQGPWKGSLVGFFQDAHNSIVSLDPATLDTPVRDFTGAPGSFNSVVGLANFGQPNFGFLSNLRKPEDNFLFDLGFNLTYKTDWLLAYVSFVKNLGSVDLKSTGTLGALGLPAGSTSADYEGFMIDIGATYFCGPWTANIGGFYTTGAEISAIPEQNGGVTPLAGTANNNNFRGVKSKDVEWFTYPLATSKYFSEIIGGGILGDDIYAIRGYGNGLGGSGVGSVSSLQTVYWRGYGFPTNLWTITAGGSYQIAEQTKLSASYWYFGTSEDVPVAYIPAVGAIPGRFQMSNSIGHELNFYVDQGIVDGLTLTLVGAYLIADDAFAPVPFDAARNSASVIGVPNKAADAYEVGARLLWNF